MKSRLRVAFMYPQAKRNALEAIRHGDEPDHLSAFDALVEHGVKPTLLDPLHRPWNPISGAHSLYSGIDPIRAFKLALTVERYDLVVSVGESSALMPLFLGIGLPVLVWDPALGGEWKARERIQRWVLPRCSLILVVGGNQEAVIRQRIPNAAPIVAIGHWEDTEYYHPMPEFQPEGYVLAVGNDPWRDYDTLAKAARDLNVPIRIRTDHAPAQSLPPNVQVISRRLPYGELRELYAKASVVAVPLHDCPHAGGINGLLEAYAMGKPVIVSDSQGIRDFTQAALVVRPNDPGALAQGVSSILSSPAKAQAMAQAGRALVESRYSRPAFAARFAAQLWETWQSSRP